MVHSKKIFSLLLASVTLVALLVIGSTPAMSRASGPEITHSLVWSAPSCYGKKWCRDFNPYFHIRERGSLSSNAKICWLGVCKPAKTKRCATTYPRCAGGKYMAKVETKFRNVGPYRCGPGTKLTLIYRGKSYTRSTSIFCYRA